MRGRVKGVSVGCSNWVFLTGIMPVGGIAGVVAPGLVLWCYGGGVGMWAGYWVFGVRVCRGWC